MQKKDRRWIWIGLGVMAILIRMIASPSFLEQRYSRGIFIGVRYFFDYTSALLPIPMLYVFAIILLSWLGSKMFRRKNVQRNLKTKVLSFLLSLFAFAGGLVFFFLFLWGYNYGRIPVEDHLKIEPKPLEKAALLQEFTTSTQQLLQAYEKVKNHDDQFYHQYVFENNLESKIRKDISNTLNRHDYPSPGRVRARLLRPEGILLRISTAGFYMPLVAECNVDAGLHPLQVPYVMSHEFAHGFGFGNEGTCNFWAYLTCTESDDPVMNYAGLLSYWRSVAAQYRRVDPEDYKSVRANLPQGILDHMRKINEQMDKFPDLFPAVRDATYEAYLKAQGVEEGLKSYSRVVLLVSAYRKKDH